MLNCKKMDCDIVDDCALVVALALPETMQERLGKLKRDIGRVNRWLKREWQEQNELFAKHRYRWERRDYWTLIRADNSEVEPLPNDCGEPTERAIYEIIMGVEFGTQYINANFDDERNNPVCSD